MAKWLLDPGHGGSDPGATYNGRRESDDVLRLAKRVGEILSSNGESVSFTRTSDVTVSLSARSSMENRGSYDYFVSIHRNAIAPEKAKGVETHIYSSGGKKQELATKVNNNLVALGFVDRKVKISNFHVLRETKCSAILIECGFIDNTVDNNLFDSKFEQIAQAIAKGCLNQIGKDTSVQPSEPNKPSNPETPSGCDPVIKSYGENGKCTITTPSGIRFRDKYCTHCGIVKGTYNKGESVYYDKVCITEKYVWISWTSASSGERRWMPIKDRKTNERWGTCV